LCTLPAFFLQFSASSVKALHTSSLTFFINFQNQVHVHCTALKTFPQEKWFPLLYSMVSCPLYMQHFFYLEKCSPECKLHEIACWDVANIGLEIYIEVKSAQKND
jgi:hypothetical protein